MKNRTRQTGEWSVICTRPTLLTLAWASGRALMSNPAKHFGFSVWWLAEGGVCYTSLSVFGFWQTIKSNFRIYHSMRFGVFPDLRLNDLNRLRLFSDFTCGFRFWSKFISVLRFSIIICTVLRYLTYFSGLLSNNGALLFLNARMMVWWSCVEFVTTGSTQFVLIF